VHSGVFYISERRRGFKRRGARGNYPTPPARRACIGTVTRNPAGFACTVQSDRNKLE